MLLTAFPTRLAAPEIAGPAEDVTFGKPSEALDCILLAVDFVVEAARNVVSLAFSVVEAHRKGDLRNTNWRLFCRISALDANETDIGKSRKSAILARSRKDRQRREV